jgi:hypothetical protein
VAIPAPHSVGPKPARWHWYVPEELRVQPWVDKSLSAADGLYGYGFFNSAFVKNALGGVAGTGP